MAGIRSVRLTSPWWVLAISTVLLACTGYFLIAVLQLDTAWTAIALGVALVVFSAAYLVNRYRLAVKQVQLGLRKAKEGLLEPAESAPGGQFLQAFTDDYNAMIYALRRMFSTVEECQARVLNERNKVEAILQSLPGALLHLSDDLQVESANKTAETLFGMGPESLIGSNLFGLLDLAETDRDILRDAFLYKNPVHNQELRVELNGREHWLSVNLAFVNENEGDMGAVVTLQDVTEYRQLQDTVAIREKLVAMGQLAAGVAHELNTPLGNILGYSQLLRDAGAKNDVLAGYANIIGEETKRCSRIVQDLLNYVRHEQCSGETCDMGTLISELIEMFISCKLKRYNIDVNYERPDGPVLVEGGCGQLDIVLTNLILNSIHAVSGVDSPRISIVVHEDDSGFVTIHVEDNGPGIPPEVRSRIFDPFFTTKNIGDGSGLGLSISQAMIMRRGGFIRHDPEYTGGARFVLRLPAVHADYAEAVS